MSLTRCCEIAVRDRAPMSDYLCIIVQPQPGCIEATCSHQATARVLICISTCPASLVMRGVRTCEDFVHAALFNSAGFACEVQVNRFTGS
jgi:hypothetical protein